MSLGQSIPGRKRDAYMAKWPQGKQNEAVIDQLKAISEALRASGVQFEDAPKFATMVADFEQIKLDIEGG